MRLDDNDFVLFGVPERFAQDRAPLDERWKQLQREAHPDRHAAQGAAAQRVAMQWSVRINEAYQRLKDPMKRAAYLCEQRGAAINAESNTAMPTAFLMQQMQWREALDEAASEADLDALARESGKAGPRIIDASTAHRTAPGWVYGFAELCAGQAERIANAQRVANPGCYATGAIALLRPLIDAGLWSSPAT